MKREVMKNIIILVLAGMFHLQASANGQNALDFEQLLPQYIAWAQEIDSKGLQLGEPLGSADLAMAREIGIKSPEKVRVVYVDEVPFPNENAALKSMGESLGLIGNGIVNNAQVFGYSIYVRRGYELDRPRLAHELVHVLQTERTSFGDTVVQHISDMAKYDYKNAPLEVEAFKANEKYAID